MKNNTTYRSCFWLTIISIFTFHTTYAQQKWANYTSDVIWGKVAFEGDNVWLPTQGGLIQINRSSGAKQVYLPSNSGLKGSSVMSVLVDTGGVKWIGSEQGGLLRFDGTNWTQYSTINTGDTLINIKDIHTDTQDRLWLISWVNGNCSGCSKLMYLENGQFHKVPNPPGVGSATSFRYLVPDNAGNVWAATQTSITKIQNDTSFVLYNAADIHFQPHEYIYGIGFDQVRNHIYVSSSEYINSTLTIYRLHRFDGTTWEEVTLPPNTPLGYSTSFQNDLEGNFWILTDNYTPDSSTLLRFDGSNWNNYSPTDLGLSDNRVYGLAFDGQGHLWIKGANGLLEQQGTTWKEYDTEIFPIGSNYFFQQAAFNRDGHAWLLSGSLQEFDGLTWKTHLPADFGITSNVDFSCVSIDTVTNTLWAGLANNNESECSVLKYDGINSTIYSLPTRYDPSKIIPLPDGKAWLACDSGLGFFDGNQWVWYNQNNSPLPSSFISDITLDLSGNLWAAVYPDNVVQFNGTQWSVFNLPGTGGWVFCDRSGRIWTGGINKIERYDGNSWSPIPEPENQIALSMTQDADLSYWFATGGGAFHWDGDNQWENFNIQNAPLTNNYVRSLQIDPFGNKWLLGIGITVYNSEGISTQFVHPTSSIHGTVFYDADQNGEQAISGEPGIPGAQVLMLPDSIRTWSVSQGNYSFFPTLGPHQIEYVPAPDYTLTSDSAHYQVIAGLADQSGFDFGAWTPNIHDSLRLDLTAGVLRCNLPNNFWLNLTNLGFLDASGQISFIYDPTLTFLSSEPPPTTIDGNTLTWQYQNLPFGATYNIQLQFGNLGPDALGDTLFYSAYADQEGSMAFASQREQAIVRCSYDPNDKLVQPTGPAQGALSLLADPLEYTIHFQNTGNDTAFTVVIRDTLNAALDLANLEVLSSSHPVRVQAEVGGVLTFVFADINLLWQKVDELGSQGYVSYRIKARENLADATIVRNTAHIYFDLNPPIVTNTTSNTLVEKLPTTAIYSEPNSMLRIRVAPNPMDDEARIEILNLPDHHSDLQLQVFDLQGSIVRETIASTPYFILKKENLSPGMYFFRILSEGKLLGNGKLVCGK